MNRHEWRKHEAATRRELQAISDDQRDEFRRLHTRENLANKRMVVNVYPALEVTLPPELHKGAGKLVALAVGTATGVMKEGHQCFACCSPWVLTNPPKGLLHVEVLGTKNHVLALICTSCFSGGCDARIVAAMQRDLGCLSESAQVIHQPGTA